ncbi:MAG TPA: hypothetical protein VGE07_24390 [Herpetosiphonaceae bacterium]
MRFRLMVCALAAGLLAWPPLPAAACSILPQASPARLKSFAGYAEIIAVGEVVAASERVFTLRVEEYWKGAERAPELTVNNRGSTIADSDCSTKEIAGPTVSVGTRLIAFLAPDRIYGVADWQFLGIFRDGYVIIDGQPSYPGSQLTYLGYPPTTAAAEIRPIVLDEIGAGEVGPPDPAAAPSHPLRAIRLALGLAALLTAAFFALAVRLVRRHRRRHDTELAGKP